MNIAPGESSFAIFAISSGIWDGVWGFNIRILLPSLNTSLFQQYTSIPELFSTSPTISGRYTYEEKYSMAIVHCLKDLWKICINLSLMYPFSWVKTHFDK
jgi:hypothetical protein